MTIAHPVRFHENVETYDDDEAETTQALVDTMQEVRDVEKDNAAKAPGYAERKQELADYLATDQAFAVMLSRKTMDEIRAWMLLSGVGACLYSAL